MPWSSAHPRRPPAALAAGAVLTLALLAPAAPPAAARTGASSPSSPVNLATPVSFGQAIARHDAIVTAGESTVSTTVPLTAGHTDKVVVTCGAADSCNVNVDTLSAAPAGLATPAVPAMNYLGGWTRSFDSATYGPGYSCPDGTPAASLGRAL